MSFILPKQIGAIKIRLTDAISAFMKDFARSPLLIGNGEFDEATRSIAHLDTRSLIAVGVMVAHEVSSRRILDAIQCPIHSLRSEGHLQIGFDTVFMSESIQVESVSGRTAEEVMCAETPAEWEGLSIPFDRHGVWMRPWEKARLLEGIPKYGAIHPWVEDPSNHCAEVLWPIPVIWVECGNHSIASGVVNKTGALTCGASMKIKDISPLFEFVGADASGLFRKSDGERLGRNGDLIWDRRYGFLFAVADQIRQRSGWRVEMVEWCRSGMGALKEADSIAS